VIALDSEWNATKNNRVYSLSDNDWVDGAIALSNLLSEADPDFIRCICWTNRAVAYLNNRIRKAVYGDRYALCGERLISTKPFYGWRSPTSSELTVLSCRSSEHDEYDYRGYRVRVNEPQKDRDFNLFVLHESVLDQWQARCDILLKL